MSKDKVVKAVTTKGKAGRRKAKISQTRRTAEPSTEENAIIIDTEVKHRKSKEVSADTSTHTLSSETDRPLLEEQAAPDGEKQTISPVAKPVHIPESFLDTTASIPEPRFEAKSLEKRRDPDSSFLHFSSAEELANEKRRKQLQLRQMLGK